MNELRELPVVAQDEWLKPNEADMERRYGRYTSCLEQIEHRCGSLVDYANGYLYFGFQYDVQQKGWWFREWLPGAQDVYLFGDFNGWQRTQYRLKHAADGVWSIFFPDEEFSGRLVHRS